jgi:hypothetical protein
MLERAASLWRRLAQRPPAAALADDRRVWVRRASGAEARLTPAGADAAPVAARVQDVSHDGARLVVDRRFEPGALLSVELPAPEGAAVTVLACVVHARPHGPGEWLLGCRFSAKLTAEDLGAFGAAKKRPTPPDSRNWSRVPCDVTATYGRVPEGEGEPRPARVLNISAGGVGLLVPEDVRVGELLAADLHAADGEQVVSILACVVHVTVRPDGQRVLSCTFIRELNDAALRALL